MDEAAHGFGTFLGSDAAYPVPADEGGWDDQPKLSGDFYGQPDDVTRGLSMAIAHADFYGLPDDVTRGVPMAIAPADFHCLPDDVTRGVSMPCAPYDMLGGLEFYGKEDAFPGIPRDIGDPDFCYQDPLDMRQCLGGLPQGLDDNMVDGTVTDHLGSAGTVGTAVLQRFTEANRPPSVPSHTGFQLTATTLRVHSTVEPFEIGNAVSDFLSTQVKSSISKVRIEKFAIKAEVFIDNASCVLKVRCYYGACAATYFVEFQRRKGDCVAFSKAYQKAAEYLSSRLPVFPAVAAVPVLPKACPPERGLGAAYTEGIAPLLDLANDASHPTLQEEGAASLSDFAQNTQDAGLLCNESAFDGFKTRLHSTQDSIAYYTACTLSALAQRPEAASCFADHGILPIIADKIRSTATSEIVQHELAQTLNTALAACATALSETVSEEIMGALADATKDVHIGNASMHRNLQEARSMLKHRHVGASGPPDGKATGVQYGGTGSAAVGSLAARHTPPPPTSRACVQSRAAASTAAGAGAPARANS